MSHGQQRVRILTYHSLDDSGSIVSVRPAAFRAHMEVLAERGYIGIGLGALLDLWDGKAAPPPSAENVAGGAFGSEAQARRGARATPVVITFDDAYANVIEGAVPVLAELGFHATVFAVAGHVGRVNDWPSPSPRVPRLPLMTAAQLRELSAAGMEIGSHGVQHVPLARVGARQAEAEIVRSRAMLEDATGDRVRTFCYPYGDADGSVRRLVAAHYDGAVSTELGAADIRSDRHWLPRLEMLYLRPPAVFRMYLGPLGVPYLGLRAVARRCRAALRPRFAPIPEIGKEGPA